MLEGHKATVENITLSPNTYFAIQASTNTYYLYIALQIGTSGRE